MKPIFRSHLWSMLLIASTACLLSCANSSEKAKGVYLPTGDVHEGWYFAAGERVIIQGTVNGDAYVVGGAVRIDGTINGDLLVAGGQVIMAGTVTSNIRATGGTIQIEGDVGRDVTAAGGSITVGKESSVSGNLLAAGSDVTITGSIGKEARLAASRLTMSGTVNGMVNFAGNELEIAPGARILGDLHLAVDDTDNVRIAPGTVQGSIGRTIKEKTRETPPPAHARGRSCSVPRRLPLLLPPLSFPGSPGYRGGGQDLPLRGKTSLAALLAGGRRHTDRATAGSRSVPPNIHHPCRAASRIRRDSLFSLERIQEPRNNAGIKRAQQVIAGTESPLPLRGIPADGRYRRNPEGSP